MAQELVCDCFLGNFCSKYFHGSTFSVSSSLILWAFNIIPNFQNIYPLQEELVIWLRQHLVNSCSHGNNFPVGFHF